MGKVWRGGSRTPRPSLGPPFSQHLSVFTSPKVSWIPVNPYSLGVFMEVLLHEHDWLNSLTISDWKSPAFLCPPTLEVGKRMTESSNPVIMPWSLCHPPPILQLFERCAKVISESNLSDTCQSGNSKGFRTSMPGAWDKNQIHVYYNIIESSQFVANA